MEPDRPRLAYQPALDGLRAAAVLAVLLYHGEVSWLSGGYLGVDAFFVLSGFLITSLLVVEFDGTGTISLLGFWARRARRLLPALGLALLGVAAYAAFVAPPDLLGTIRADALATLGYVANWHTIAAGHQYMDQFSVPSPLMHTWSLAIEEQFYFVWPPVALGILAWRRRGGHDGRRFLLGTAVALALASAAWMAFLQRGAADVSRAYYGTDTRAQSVFVGAALAIAVSMRGPVRSRGGRVAVHVAACAGALWTLWVWHSADQAGHTLYRGGYLLGAVAVAAVILSVTQPAHGLLGAALGWTPMRWIGRISYGLYLFHWPVFLTLTPERTGLDGTPLLLERLAVTFGVATASYFFVEMPIRRGTFTTRSWRALAPATAVVLALAIVVSTRGARDIVALPTSGVITSGVATRSAAGAPADHSVLMLGDSVALTLGVGLVRNGPAEHLDIVDAATLGCGVLRGTVRFHTRIAEINPGCLAWEHRWSQLVDRYDPKVVTLLVGAWDLFDIRPDGQASWLVPTTKAWATFARHELQQAVDVLSAGGARVVLLTAPYFDVREGLTVEEPERSHFNPARVDALNQVLHQLAAAEPARVSLIDLNRFTSPDARFTDTLNGLQLRGDGVHFTQEGADLTAQWLAPQLAAIARTVSTGRELRGLQVVAAPANVPDPDIHWYRRRTPAGRHILMGALASSAKGRGTIVLVPGSDGLSTVYVSWARQLAARGYDVTFGCWFAPKPQVRAPKNTIPCGDAPKSYGVTPKSVAAVDTLVDMSREVFPGRVALAGFSRGGGVVALRASLGHREPIVTVSGVVENWTGFGPLPGEDDVTKEQAKGCGIRGEVLIVQAQLDGAVPPEQADYFAAALTRCGHPPTRFALLTGHGLLYDEQSRGALSQRIDGFLQGAFSKRGGTSK